MSVVWRGSFLLCCFVFGERRHGCGEVGVPSSFVDGGFPVSSDDDCKRSVNKLGFFLADGVDDGMKILSLLLLSVGLVLGSVARCSAYSDLSSIADGGVVRFLLLLLLCERTGDLVLPIHGAGLVACPTSSGGLLPLWGSCCPACRGRCLRRQTPRIWRCDGCQPSLLACAFIVFKVHWFSDVLLSVPVKILFLRRCGDRSHGWLRSSATRKTGVSCKDLDVIFISFFVRWVVNYQFHYE